MPKQNQDTCKYCLQEIEAKAKVCHHCSRSQHIVVHFIGWWLPHIVAIVLAVLGVWQFYEAKQENIKAQEAYEKAIETENRINETRTAIGKTFLAISNNINNMDTIGKLESVLKKEGAALLNPSEEKAVR